MQYHFKTCQTRAGFLYSQIKMDDVVTFETTFQIQLIFSMMFALSANVALPLLGLCARQSYPVFTLIKDARKNK